MKGRYPRRDTTIPVRRAGVHFNSVENVIDGEHWPVEDPDNITSLKSATLIQDNDRIRFGLGNVGERPVDLG